MQRKQHASLRAHVLPPNPKGYLSNKDGDPEKAVSKVHPSYVALAEASADLLFDRMLTSIEEYFEKRLREEEGVPSHFVSDVPCQRVQLFLPSLHGNLR